MNAKLRRIGAFTLLVALLLTVSDARADRLRKLKIGEEFPAFTLRKLDGGTVSSDEYRGKVLVIVFLSAEQHSSEQAAMDAAKVVADIDDEDVRLLYASADVIYGSYFKEFREEAGLTQPLGFDTDRTLYEKIGLIVLPTTVVLDREGKLAHVIAIRRSDYAQTLDLYVLHTLGLISTDEMQRQLSAKLETADNAASQALRHRAVARLLREKGLLENAERELNAALKLAPDDVSIRLDLASLYLADDRSEEAERVVSKVLVDNPDHRRARLLHGIVLFRAGKLDEAEPLFQELLVLNPDPARTHYYLGRIYEQTGEKDKAIQHYREALVRFMSDEPD